MASTGARIPDWLSVDRIAESPIVYFRGRPGEITAVSPNVERLIGYQARELVGQPNFWLHHLHPDEAPALIKSARAATRQQLRSTNLVYRFRHRNGSYRWINWMTHRSYGEAGTIDELFGFVLDVTDQHEARLVREQLLVEQGQIQGVTATARQVEDSLNNVFAVATAALELAQTQGADSAIVQPAIEGLLAASKQIALLRQVVRVSLTETPVGPALDLARSVAPQQPPIQ